MSRTSQTFLLNCYIIPFNQICCLLFLFQLPVQQKLSKTTVASLVPVQTATPQLQTIKTASVARKSPPIIPIRTQSPATLVHAPDANAAPIVIDDDVPAVAVVQNAVVTEHVVQSGVQNKTPARLTPVQQQQILQTLKQKVMPVQQAVVGTQYKTIAKQKPVAVQLAKQQAVPGTSLLTHGKTIVAGKYHTNNNVVESTKTANSIVVHFTTDNIFLEC